MSRVDGSLQKMFHDKVPGHWWGIETGSTRGGVPDSNFCLKGTEGWVEFKQTHSWTVKFRPAQPGSISKRVRFGGRVWVAVRRWGTRLDPQDYDELWLVHGRDVLPLVAAGLRAVRDCRDTRVYSGGPRGWDWEDVYRALRS